MAHHGHRGEHSPAKGRTGGTRPASVPGKVSPRPAPRLDLVVKCGSAGCIEAVCAAIRGAVHPEVALRILHAGVGAVSNSDVFTAATGSRLVVGFDVDAMPYVEKELRRFTVEARLYSVIYNLTDDIGRISASLVPDEAPAETILGAGRVIALFKSSRHGIILGCEVREGRLAQGDAFRVIGAAGTTYQGRIESLHIGREAVAKAEAGQQAGVKIRDFQQARIGDLVESYRKDARVAASPWQPAGRLFRL